MFALTRRPGEEVFIGNPHKPLIVIRVVEIMGDSALLCFTLPRSLVVRKSTKAQVQSQEFPAPQTVLPDSEFSDIEQHVVHIAGSIGDAVVIGDKARTLGVIHFVWIKKIRFRIGFDFPRDVPINRREIALAKDMPGASQ